MKDGQSRAKGCQSHHLAVLKEAGLVSDDRQGKYIYYELNLSESTEGGVGQGD